MKPRAGELALQPLDVAVQHRLDRGVDRRRRAALVLAVLGDDGVARGHVAVRPERAHDLGGARLVRRVDVAVEEVDDDALGAEREQLPSPPPRPAPRRAARSTSPSASMRSSTSSRRSPLDQRHEAALQAVRRRPGAAAELEHVAKAARRDQADGARSCARAARWSSSSCRARSRRAMPGRRRRRRARRARRRPGCRPSSAPWRCAPRRSLRRRRSGR